jgi:hypothetical protein
VFHPEWRLISRDTDQGIMASGPYVLLGNNTASLGTLIDNRDHQHSQVPVPPSCVYSYGDDVLSDPWLGRVCGVNSQPDLWLYSLTQHTWRDVGAPAPVLQQRFDCGGVVQCTLNAPTVGRYWIGWSFTCGAHCDPSSLPAGFSDIQTGAWQPQTNSSTTIDDPNSPSLTVKLCRPLGVPPGASITFYGRFAVLDQEPLGRPDYLERCSSDLRRRIPGDTTGDSDVVIDNPGTTKLDGIFLPSLRPFVIPLGRGMPGGRTEFLLSDHTLYASFGSSVWTAPVPTAGAFHRQPQSSRTHARVRRWFLQHATTSRIRRPRPRWR